MSRHRAGRDQGLIEQEADSILDSLPVRLGKLEVCFETKSNKSSIGQTPGKYRQEPQEIKVPKGVHVNANLLLNCFWKEVTSKYVTKEMCTLLQTCSRANAV